MMDTREAVREAVVWALFKATFHPDEGDALMRQKWVDWASERRPYYRKADAAIAAHLKALADAGYVVLRQPVADDTADQRGGE